jgi:hypothetical protein
MSKETSGVAAPLVLDSKRRDADKTLPRTIYIQGAVAEDSLWVRQSWRGGYEDPDRRESGVVCPKFFLEMAVVIDTAKLMEIMRRYGLTPFTPSSSLATQAVNYLIQPIVFIELAWWFHLVSLPRLLLEVAQVKSV